MTRFRKFLLALAVSYLPGVCIVALFAGGDGSFFTTPFAFDFLVALLYSFPLLIGVEETGLCISRLAENKAHCPGKTVYHTVRLLISLFWVVLQIVGRKWFLCALVLAILFLIEEAVHWIRCKDRKNLFSPLGEPSFWGIVAGVLLFTALCAGIFRFFAGGGRQSDALCLFSLFGL